MTLSWISSIRIFCFFLALAGVFAARASDRPDFHHTAWTSENGLGSVFDLQQSSDGYLWLTTSRGVMRFDGVRFQSVADATYGAVDGNEIDSVLVPPSGGLWLTTTSAGLLFWKDGKLSTFPDRRCTPTRKMGRLIEDRDGSLWIQGAAGLFHLRGSTCEQVGTKEGYPGGFAAGIFLDSDGTLWVKTRSGPLLFKPQGAPKFTAGEFGKGPSTSYAFLHEAPDGSIWLSDDQGLRRVASKLSVTASFEPGEGDKKNTQFGDFTFAPDGSLWAVTSKGVQRFDDVGQWPTPVAKENAPGSVFTPAQGLSSDAAWKVLIDREGVVWVATNSGLDRLRRNALNRLALPPAREREFSIAIGDQGSVWTGNSSMPFTHVAADGKTRSFPGIGPPISIRRDHTGTIWTAGAGDVRLWRSSGAGFQPVHYPDEKLDSVVSAAVDRNNEPWILARSGRTYHYSDGKWKKQNTALGKKPGVIGAMTDDQEGNIWFAFSDKVVQWDGSAYHSFVRKARDVSETTMSVRGAHVWLAGPGGVQLFTQGQFYTMQWNDPEQPGRASGVVETQTGELWVNGFSGISHLPADELKKWLSNPNVAVSAEHLDELDGLPGLSGEKLPEPSVLEGPDGKIWFATIKGIAWVEPAALDRNRNRLPPPVVISSVHSNGRIQSGLTGLSLPAGTENLQIDYAALSLAMPERVTFRYQLEGADTEWQNVGTRRQAYYTKLRPGSYRFHVAAANDRGVWNEAGATLDLRIAPAWYQTSWFLALCGVGAIALAAAAYRLRVRQLAAGISARFDERLQERIRIAQELHDTLLQGFLSASMHAHIASDRLPADSNAAPILNRAIQLMDQVIDEGRNAIRGLRSEQNAVDLERAFAAIQRELDPQFANT
ncbi:MAG: triple tyrosine motif-containing protein, partial [Bryobacteraceae bacterium]